MNVLIVIPARLESIRLPRKLLLNETGKTLIEHTVEAAIATGHRVAVESNSIDICRAIDHLAPEISTASRPEPVGSGTERISRMMPSVKTPDLVVCFQADEPEIKPEHVQHLIDIATSIPGCDMATLASIATVRDQNDPNAVKVRRGEGGNAEAFSRSPMAKSYRHIGIYAYTPKFLKWYASQGPTVNEERESLEQLRALDRGCRIRVGIVDHPHRGIDTREDYDAFVRRYYANAP